MVIVPIVLPSSPLTSITELVVTPISLSFVVVSALIVVIVVNKSPVALTEFVVV